MPKIILHIGSHKTGTTSIQASLAASRAALADAGILYPDVSPFFGGRRDAQHEFAHALVRDDAQSSAKVAAFLDYLQGAKSRYDTILISAEPLYRHALALPDGAQESPEAERTGRCAYLDRVATLFGGFETEAVLYLRSPLSFAESLYANAIVNSLNRQDFDPYIAKRAIRFDYRFQLDALHDRFDRVTLRSFEQDAADGLVSSFFSRFCSGLHPAETGRLRTGVEKGAVAWILREKKRQEMTLRAVRERWHFALQPEHQDLFRSPVPTTFWQDGSAREAFHRRTADTFPELSFSEPGPKPESLFWTDEAQLQAEDRWSRWSKTNASYLAARHRLSLPAYMQGPRPSVVVGLSEAQIVAETRAAAPLRAAICVITRNRKKMMRNLLDTFQSMEIPANVDPVYVIIENADTPELSGIVDEFRAGIAPCDVIHDTEPALGIPIARNTAVRTALLAGASVVLFVDDDEVVTPDWLEKLVARYRSSDLMLVGGPVLADFDSRACSLWQRLLREGIRHRYNNKNRKSDALWRKGQERKITIVTNNWLADSQIFTKYGMSFDETLLFTGGSDTNFFHRVADRGIPTGWAASARVIETVPESRVSLRYQFDRSMGQSRNSLNENFRRRGVVRTSASVVVVLPLRLIGLAVTALLIPVTGGKGLIELARNSGWLAGRISGILGARSRLYSKLTGY